MDLMKWIPIILFAIGGAAWIVLLGGWLFAALRWIKMNCGLRSAECGLRKNKKENYDSNEGRTTGARAVGART